MTTEESQRRFARAAPRCAACDYDHSGLTSANCPECGAPRTRCLMFSNMNEYFRAMRALSAHGLVLRSREPRTGLTGITGESLSDGLLASQGGIWVDLTRADEIERVIDEAGLAISLEPRPIVDRAEPVCPHCQADLDAGDDEERCSRCGGAFQWVEIAGQPVALDDVHCSACGYALRGLRDAVCPECGTLYEPNPSDVVHAAAGEWEDSRIHDDQDSNTDRHEDELRINARRRTITVAIIIGIVAVFLLFQVIKAFSIE